MSTSTLSDRLLLSVSMRVNKHTCAHACVTNAYIKIYERSYCAELIPVKEAQGRSKSDGRDVE